MTRRSLTADAVLFDLDGTLVDSRGDIAFSVNHTLTALGRPALDVATVERYVGDGVRQLLARAAGPMDEKTTSRALEIFLPHYLEHCADTTRPYPGVMETLKRFSGKSLAVVTNKPEAHTWKTLRAAGMENFFRVVLGGDTLPTRKPAPEPLWEALNRTNTARNRAVMVGDSLVDIQAARAAHVPVVAVTYGFRPAEELAAALPDALINSFSDLSEVLR